MELEQLIKKIYNEGYCMGWTDRNGNKDFNSCPSSEFIKIIINQSKGV